MFQEDEMPSLGWKPFSENQTGSAKNCQGSKRSRLTVARCTTSRHWPRAEVAVFETISTSRFGFIRVACVVVQQEVWIYVTYIEYLDVRRITPKFKSKDRYGTHKGWPSGGSELFVE